MTVTGQFFVAADTPLGSGHKSDWHVDRTLRARAYPSAGSALVLDSGGRATLVTPE